MHAYKKHTLGEINATVREIQCTMGIGEKGKWIIKGAQ